MNFGSPAGSGPLTKSTGMQPNTSATHSLSCREDSWKVYDEGGDVRVAKPASASAQSSDPFPVGSTAHTQPQRKPPPHLIPAPIPGSAGPAPRLQTEGRGKARQKQPVISQSESAVWTHRKHSGIGRQSKAAQSLTLCRKTPLWHFS